MMNLDLQFFGGRGSAGSRGGGGSTAVKVTKEEAYEDYFEYENAQLMKKYSETGKMPTEDLYNNKLSNEQREKLKAEADLIQNSAVNTKENTLYRGMVMNADEVRALTPGDTYKITSLTSTSTDKKISSIYSNVENSAVDNPVPVMVTFQQSGGIKGFQVNKDTPEVILPKGQSYKVVRNYMDKNGVVQIELYAKKGSNK